MRMYNPLFLRRISGKIFLAVLFVFCVTTFGSPAFAGRIVVYGDSQVDEVAQRKVVQAILKQKPSIIFRVGDLVNDGNVAEQWELFNNINSDLLKSTEYYPVLGNHEGDSLLYFYNFKRINHQRWYSVERDGIHFVALDSNSVLRRGSEQYTWLESDLSSMGRDIKFLLVFFHHSLFSVGDHVEDEKGLQTTLLPLFKQHGVSAVFSGHDHNYQRFLYDGIYYVVTGGGGSALRDSTRKSRYLQKFQKAYHFCSLVREKNFLKVRVLDVNLNLVDEFEIPSFP